MPELKPGIYAMRSPTDVRYVRGVMRTGTNVPVTHDDLASSYCRHLINTQQLLFVMDMPVGRNSAIQAEATPAAPARASDEPGTKKSK